MPLRRAWRTPRRLFPALVAALAACGGGGDGGTPPPGPPASITVPTTTVTLLGVPSTQTVTATVRDASNNVLAAPSIAWSSDAPAVVTATGAGTSVTLTAVGRGTATVRGTAGSASVALNVTVRGVQAVAITNAPAQLRQTDTLTLRATVTADSGIATAVTWTSDNPAIATVSTTGLLTGVAAGSVTITAAAQAQPAIRATRQIQVTPPRAFTVRPDTVRLARTQTATITADLLLEPGANRTITWRTSNAGIANVSQAGVITAVGPGTATITALPQADTIGLRRTVTAIISPLVTNVTVSPTSTQTFINQPVTLTATVAADAGANTTVRWSSANPSIATVNAQGVVTGVALGFTTITAISNQDSTRQAAAQVNVVRRPIGVTIQPSTIGINVGGTAPVAVEVVADPGVSTAVTWAVANPAIATIDRNTGVLTGVALGTTTITATSVADPTRSSTATVNVVPRLAARWGLTRINGELVDDVTGIWCPRETACFAVSATAGDILRLENGAWRVVSRGAAFNRRFLAIGGDANGNLAYAVGTGGLVARFTGATWTQMQAPVTTDLNEVALADNGQAVAVGNNGTVIRLRDGVWSRITAPAGTGPLNAVSFAQGTWYLAGDNGTLLRMVDTTFTRFETNTVEHLRGVLPLTASSGFAVGDFGTILQFAGTTVTPVTSNTTADLLHLSTGASGTLLAVGDGIVLQFTGAEWRRLSPPYATRLFAAYVDASGTALVTGQRGLVMELRGGAWTTRNVAPDLLDVWTADATTAWTVGELGFIYRWNGTAWTRQPAPTTQRLNGVWAANPTTVFAVGDSGTILRSTDGGANWTTQTAPTRSDLIGIWGTGANAAVAVGVGGEFLTWNGTAWQQAPVVAPGAMYGVFGSSASDVWSVGDAGQVFRNDGTGWTRVPLASQALLVGLWVQSPQSVFTVGQLGDQAAVLRYNGTTWQTLNAGTTNPLASIWGPNANDLYAVGANGTIVRFDGTAWSTMTSGTTDFLWAVSGTPGATGGLAVGFNSTVLVANLTTSSLMAMQQGARAVSLEPGRGARAGSRVLREGRARRAVRVARR